MVLTLLSVANYQGSPRRLTWNCRQRHTEQPLLWEHSFPDCPDLQPAGTSDYSLWLACKGTIFKIDHKLHLKLVFTILIVSH